MKKLFALLLLLTSFGVQAKEISVVAFGEGETYDWAVLNAVENAVRQTNEISIEGNGLHKIDISSSITREQSQSGNRSSNMDASLNANGKWGRKGNLDAKGNANSKNSYADHKTDTITAGIKDNSKHIPAKYKGAVSSYEVLEHTEEKGVHRVKIKAFVNQACPAILNCATQKADCSCYVCQIGYKLVDKECLPCDDKEVCGCVDGKKWSKEQNQCVYDAHDYKSKNLIKKADYSLAVLPFKTLSGNAFKCSGKTVPTYELDAEIENILIKKFSGKFNLLDRKNFKAYNTELSLITQNMTLPENQVKLRNIVSADYILVGSIDDFKTHTEKRTSEEKGTYYEQWSNVKFSYKILEAATMEIIEADTLEKRFDKSERFDYCFDDAHDYKSKNLVKKADYSLAVLPFKARTQFKCLGQKVSSDDLNTLITNAFVENLVPSRKFNLVDRNNFDNYASELSLITADLTLSENKTRLKNIVPADYILVGTIENFSATQTKEVLELTGETTYESTSKLKLSYRILETATMEIVSSGSVEKKFSKDSAFSSCDNVEELLVGRAVKDASNKLLTDIFPDYKVSKSSDAKNPAKKKAKPVQPVDYSLMLD